MTWRRALRNAVVAADAVLLVTHDYAPVPAIVHNAIDWLTMRWNGSQLHEKPHAAMAYSADCFTAVFGLIAHQGTITVGSLREAVAKLAGEVSAIDEVAPDFARDNELCAATPSPHRRCPA
jgi:NADPH-dependent FMN reductase